MSFLFSPWNARAKKDCPERSANCHVLCERWKQYEAWKREIYEKADRERMVRLYLSKSMKRNNHDYVKKKRRNNTND